jgi:hypothetical protein
MNRRAEPESRCDSVDRGPEAAQEAEDDASHFGYEGEYRFEVMDAHIAEAVSNQELCLQFA